jgi:hypothetical protein
VLILADLLTALMHLEDPSQQAHHHCLQALLFCDAAAVSAYVQMQEGAVG